MASSYTSLLGLALPVTGELSGSWGDVVNDSITSLLDTAVAGTTTLSTDGDVTLSTTTGASNQARQAILLCSGARTALRTITAPAQSKIYTVINATTGGYSVKVVGAGPTTGVTIVAGESAVIAWNGSDFIKVSNTGGSASFTNVTISGTTTLSGLTASTALALNASKEVVSVTNTGTGNNVLSASPTLTGTISGANASLSGTLAVTGVATLTAQPILSSLTASQAVFTDGSKGLVSNAITGTGNVVMSASPTLTGTLAAAAANFSGNVTLGDASTDTVTVNGYMGVGGAAGASTAITVAPTALTGTLQYGVSAQPTGTSAATNSIIAFDAYAQVANSAFTVSNVYGLSIRSGSKGASATATNWHGIQIADQTQGTNNYGITSLVSSGTNKWNIYASGTAQNYFAGNVGIGTTAFANSTLRVSTTDGTYPLGVSGTTKGLRIVTSATDVRLDAVDNTLAASYEPLYLNGSIVKFGTSLTERMRLDSTGLGIGTSSPTNALSVTGSANITGNTTLGDASTDTVTVNGYMGVGGAGNPGRGIQVVSTALTGGDQIGVYSNATASSSATTALRSFYSVPKTAIAAFTCANIYGFSADDASLGAGSSVTNLVGVQIADQTQGTNNYGLRSLVSSGSNKWNIYASGTADNYFAGRVGFGTTSLGGGSGQYRFSGSITGATTSSGLLYTPTIQSDATANAYVFHSQPSTAAAAFTITNLVHYHATQATIGAGSTVTNQFGFNVQSTLTGATNNYGFYGGIASGTGRWNLYMAGTADNYFAGNLGIGTSSPGTKLDVKQSGSNWYDGIRIVRSSSDNQRLVLGNTSGASFIASVDAAGGTNNALLFGRSTDGTTFTESARFDSSGNLLVGTTASGGQSGFAVLKGGSGIETRIEIAHNFGTASGVKYVDFLYATGTIGSITQNGTTAVAYNTSSDYRLKNITGPITTSGAYIDSLNPVEGTWKADGSTFVGLIAHEVQEASRTTVATGVKDGEEMQGMDYSSAEIIANLIAEVKSLRARVAALEAA